MAKDKKKKGPFWKLFTKSKNPSPAQTTEAPKTKPKEIFVIEPTQEETFVVDSESNEVFVIEPTQGETFVMEATEEDSVDLGTGSNDIFVIEPTKEYKILGLDADVSDAEVKKRYRQLIKQYHPDKGGDPKEFMKIRRAYNKIMEARANS
ncbi:J domain-containing protein [[Eubacterium] cellulosolvens]